MTTRIHWTEEERELVIARALELVHLYDLSFYDALRQAQVGLPTQRQRSFTTHSSAAAEIKLLRTRHTAYEASMAKKVVPPTVVDPVPPAPPEPQLAISIDAMIEAIAVRIASMLGQAIKREVKELEHAFKLEKHDPTYAGSSIHKPRVVVIGLIPDQEQLITREFQDRFALKFINAADAKHATVPDANAYLLMKNFISHAVYDKYQAYPQHVLIDGGMSALRMWFNTKGGEL